MDTIGDSHAVRSNSQKDGRVGVEDGGERSKSRNSGRTIEMNTTYIPSSSTQPPLPPSPTESEDEHVDDSDGYVFGSAPGPRLAQGSGRALGPGNIEGIGQSPARRQGPATLSFIGNNVFPSPGGTQQHTLSYMYISMYS